MSDYARGALTALDAIRRLCEGAKQPEASATEVHHANAVLQAVAEACDALADTWRRELELTGADPRRI